MLSNLRSFRDHDVSTLLQTGERQGQVKGEFLIDEDSKAELKVELISEAPPRVQKRAYINQKLAKSSADYFGVKLKYSPVQFHAINLNPTSTDLIRGEPALRRAYLNQVTASENPLMMNTLKRFQKVIDQKNALLKQEHGFDPEILFVLNQSLAKDAAEILLSRLEYLNKIQGPIESFLGRLAPSQKSPKLGYFSKVFDENFSTNINAQIVQFNGHFVLPELNFLVELYHRQLIKFSTQERVRKSCLVGPHRDDFFIKIESAGGESRNSESRDLVDVGSQGEVRSFLLALKLAELEEFQSQTGVMPVLLIDDFSSELDHMRRGFLLDYLKDSQLQTFVTATDDPAELNAKGKTFKILQGTLNK